MNKQFKSRRLRASLALLGASIAVLGANSTHIHGSGLSFLYGTAVGVLIGLAIVVLARRFGVGPCRAACVARSPRRFRK